ncbi:MAG: hypothetical protein HY006_01370 [Candidatus Sungbacteria bacterium]|nr:hypothetical protein [Candidatus Sungbacteria bacterium]
MIADIKSFSVLVGALVVLAVAGRWLGKGFRTPDKAARSFSADYWDLVRSWGLVDKVEIRKDWHPPTHTITLFRIVRDEDERDFPLPPPFVARVRDFVQQHYGARTKELLGTTVQFDVGPGKTWEEIKAAQESWAYHCEMFWAGAGG